MGREFATFATMGKEFATMGRSILRDLQQWEDNFRKQVESRDFPRSKRFATMGREFATLGRSILRDLQQWEEILRRLQQWAENFQQ